MKSDNYIVIQGWMCNELNLKGNELLVFALIYGFSQDTESTFSGGRKYISDTFNISLPTVDKALQSLLDKNLIIKQSSNDYVHTDIYRIRGSKETLLGVVKKLYQGSKETLLNNIDNISTKVEIKENTKVFSQPKTVVQENLLEDTSKIELPKTKKQNLFIKCATYINEFTADEEVREKLKDYLGIRLERKDAPMGFKAFQGMLKKLRDLTDSKEECLRIIQQSIDKSYLSFFPIREYTSYNKKTGKNVETISDGNRYSVSDEEKERLRRLVESGEREAY